ncbi:hypothetical protein [Aliivibrio fischeri]|uniref:hypothetical protein n=1 Tax=Aliivibrio fischeri TaxID=668 RepID=UPI001F184DD3|nr:hypothetical protein [Aliivibrio fischeri]MCE7535628.1 hypothetical protein [Aliivibrio fischeri]MCE7559206.1 hypothetical protein [Aliivibrio fischeri]
MNALKDKINLYPSPFLAVINNQELHLVLKKNEEIIYLSLVLVNNRKFKILKHRTQALTERYKGKVVDETWVLAFVQHNIKNGEAISKVYRKKDLTLIPILSSVSSTCNGCGKRLSECMCYIYRNIKKSNNISSPIKITEKSLVSNELVNSAGDEEKICSKIELESQDESLKIKNKPTKWWMFWNWFNS